MKNIILILIAVLIVVAGILTLVSSNADYAAEKLLYQTVKINKKIIENPDVAPPAMLTSVENKLKKILKRYPKAQTAKVARLSLAEFYLQHKKYPQAISVADDLIKIYTEDKAILSTAHFLKGAAFEKQDQWEKALKEYKILQDEYANTQVGLPIPLYIADYYTRKERYALAFEAHNEAIQFYQGLRTENKGKLLGYLSANLLFQTFVKLRQYEQAGAVLEDIVNNYPKLNILLQQFANVDSIFVQKLNKPDKAIEIYNKIKEKTDNAEIIKVIDEKIKSLEVPK